MTADGRPTFGCRTSRLSSARGSRSAQPRIYFGEQGTDYTIVDTKHPEFDYPGAGGDVYRAYDGTGGIAIGSPLTRLALALRFKTIKSSPRVDHVAEPRPDPPQHQDPPRALGAVPAATTPTRTWSSPRGTSTGFRTPTQPPAPIPYSTPRTDDSTTCATRSRSSSTPTTAMMTLLCGRQTRTR